MFRRARADERELLDAMTLAGVRHWGHDVDHPEAYRGLVALLAADDGPEHHPVWVLEEGGEAIAFYDLRDCGEHVELLRMFMRPDLIGQGYGRKLWDHATTQAAEMHDRMLIMSDPGATGFYAAMGATLTAHHEVAPGFVLDEYWYDLHSVLA